MTNERRSLLDWEKDECAELKAAIADFNSRHPKKERLTQEDIALSLGMSQGTLGSHLNGYRPVTQKLAVGIASLLKIPVETFNPRIAKEIAAMAMTVAASQPSGRDHSNVEQGPQITSAPRKINIVGTAQMGPDGYWSGLDGNEGWVETYSRDEDAYALRLKGDSMAPAIRNGWIAVCEPNHRLVPGEYVMVTTIDGQSMVKELLFENEESVSLMSVNAAYGERRSIAWADIEKIHYVGTILAPSKILGNI